MNAIAMMHGLLAAASAGAAYTGWDTSSLPANVTSADGGFTVSRSAGSNASRVVSHALGRTSGKYAIRIRYTKGATGNGASFGIRNGATGTFLGANAAAWALWFEQGPGAEQAWHNNASTSHSLVSTYPAEGMIELDLDAGNVWLGAGGAWAGGGDPATGTSPTFTGVSGSIVPCVDLFYLSAFKLLKPDEFTTPASAGFTAGWPD